MCKMPLCGLAILAAVWLGAGCSGTGLKPGRGTAGAGGSTNGPVGGGVGGTTIGAGGVMAGGVSGASGGMSGTSSCIVTECIGPQPCVPASQPRPNLCGCPIPTCEPDAGTGGSAGTATGGAISTGGTGGATILDAGSAGCTRQGSLIAVGQQVDQIIGLLNFLSVVPREEEAWTMFRPLAREAIRAVNPAGPVQRWNRIPFSHGDRRGFLEFP